MLLQKALSTRKKGPGAKVAIRDARHGTDFAKQGFTLLQLSEKEELRDLYPTNQRALAIFQAEVESHLRKLFPHAVRFVWTSAVARGGSSLGQQPAAINAPHLDYSQDEPATRAFFQKHKLMVAEPSMILGELDGDDLELETLLGVWKPIRRSAPVTNHPLALMDASTFRPEHERSSEGSINFIVMTLPLLSGGILHHPDQRWFYYPDQTTSEALLFTQYTRGRHFANPHGARVGVYVRKTSS